MRLWHYINILSIDVALGAVAGCAFFARLLDVPLLPHAYVSLGLIVWIVYTLDHLLDARRQEGEPSTERHRFHKRYHRPLTWVLIAAGTVVAFEALYVRKPVLYAGVGIALLVIGYLSVQANLKSAKEVAGAMLYTAGIVAGPWSLLHRSLIQPELAMVALYGLTALINLLIFSLFDRETDLQDDHVSFATIFGSRLTLQITWAGFAVVGVLGCLMILKFPGYSAPTLTLWAMNAVLFYTLLFRNRLRTDDLYRRLGDAAFLLPVIYLLYDHALPRI